MLHSAISTKPKAIGRVGLDRHQRPGLNDPFAVIGTS